jgi:hypothetical protein
VDFGIGFATSELAVLSAARRGAQIVEGVYAFEAQSGLTYMGQTNNMTRRFAEHVADGKATQSAVDVAQKSLEDKFQERWRSKQPLTRGAGFLI